MLMPTIPAASGRRACPAPDPALFDRRAPQHIGDEADPCFGLRVSQW